MPAEAPPGGIGATARPPFHLLETLLWRRRSGFFLRQRHVGRLQASARHFERPLDLEQLHHTLDSLDQALRPQDHPRQRVRLLADASGAVEAQATPFPCGGRQRWTAVLDDRPVDSRDPFLRHKTTCRTVYDQALQRWPRADEVLLFNERGELTESTRANLVLERNGEWFTPPLECGLLPGTYREELLARGRLREAVLPIERLAQADSILLINSLRGFIRVTLEDASGSRGIGDGTVHCTASGSSSST